MNERVTEFLLDLQEAIKPGATLLEAFDPSRLETLLYKKFPNNEVVVKRALETLDEIKNLPRNERRLMILNRCLTKSIYLPQRTL